jgi:zinc protease
VGMKLALLPKQTRADVVVAQIVFHFGTEKDFTGHEEAASLVGPLLMRGSKRHNYQQLREELDRLKAVVTVGSGDGDAYVSIRAKRETFLDALALVREILREPAFPADQLEIMRKEGLAGLEESRSDPRAQARIALDRRAYPYPKTDIRYTPTTDEGIARMKAVTLDEVKAVYGLWGLSRSEMTVVGAFDPEVVVAAVDKGLGDWKSPRPYERIAYPYKAVPGSAETVDTPDKENAVLLAALPLELRDDDPDYPALRMAAYVLGSGNPSRLFDRLREKEGWSYGVAAAISADSQDRRGQLDVFAIVAPQNSAKALAAILEELDRLVDKGVTADELARAKTAYRSQFTNGLANDDAVVSLLNRDLHLDRTLAFQQKIVDAVDALTPADLAAALARRSVKGSALVRVTAGDMKKAASQKRDGDPSSGPRPTATPQ